MASTAGAGGGGGRLRRSGSEGEWLHFWCTFEQPHFGRMDVETLLLGFGCFFGKIGVHNVFVGRLEELIVL